MQRKLLSFLIEYSYVKGQLREDRAMKITQTLSKRDVKVYIRGLKLSEQKRKVYIAIAKRSVYTDERKLFKGIFEGKELILQEDPSLLLGAKIRDNDIVYDFSLKERIENIADKIDEI